MRVLPESAGERRRVLALAVLLVLLGVWAWWPAGAPQGPSGGVGEPSAAGADRAAVASSQSTLQSLTLPEAVRLEALERGPRALAVGRNLFRYGSRPLPPPPPPLDTPRAATQPSAPPRPTGPPAITLRLMGRFEAPDGRIVVTLKDPASGALFHASENEIVDGRYRIIKVGAQSVVVSYLDGSGQRTIALGGS
ncbi:MAG TPA: hypothetical protein VLA20_04710 [Vicinamibacterales bacterium]|nr:hypothetical protein [Vicinamibacterales bacterium]